MLWSWTSLSVISEQERSRYLNGLNATYTTSLGTLETFKARIKVVRDGLSLLPSSDQQILEKNLVPIDTKLATVQSSLDTLNTQAQDKIAKATELTGVSKIVSDAKASMTTAVLSAYSGIDSSLRNVENQFKQMTSAAATTKAREDLLARQQQKQKIITLLSAITPILSSLQKTDKDVRTTMILYEQTGQLNFNTMQTLTDQYVKALGSAYAAYTAGEFPIVFTDSTNYARSIMMRLINLYLHDISTTINKADQAKQQALKNKTSKNQYYQYLYALSQRLQGTKKLSDPVVIAQGYGAIIAKQAQAYFGQNSKTVTDYYVQKKMYLSLEALGNALLDLSMSVTAPSQIDLVRGYALYSEIMSDVPSAQAVNELLAQEVTQKSNSYMALLYVHRAQSALNAMNVEKDTSSLLSIIIDAYQRAQEYFSNAGDKINSDLYQGLAQYLLSAQQIRVSAESAAKAGNSASAITYYSQAYEKFVYGGDSIDAQQVSMKKNQLLGAQNSAKGKKFFEDFLSQYTTLMQSYMAYISTANGQTEINLNSYTVMLTALRDACKNALDAFNAATVNYAFLGESTELLNQAIFIIQNIKQGLDTMFSADTFALSATVAGLNQAQSYYEQARSFFTIADQNFKASLADYIPCYPSLLVTPDLVLLLKEGQQWNLQTVVQRHGAKRYMEIANALSFDIPLALQYYISNIARQDYLPQAMETALTTTLKSVPMSVRDTVYASAKTQEQGALAFTITDWQPKKDMIGYESVANDTWLGILRQYYTVLYLGAQEARQEYLRSVLAYAQAYNTNVPEEYYPSAGAALIYYRQYVLYVLGNDAENRAISLATLAELTSEFFTSINDALAAIEKPELISSITGNQNKIISLVQEFDTIMSRQQAIIAQARALYPKSDAQSLMLFHKTVDIASGDITLSMGPAGEAVRNSVVIPNPTLKLADIYQQQADTFFENKNYKDAYPNYYNAQINYQKAAQAVKAQQAKDKGDFAYARALVTSYMQLVIPNEKDFHGIGSAPVAGVTVPERYELYKYALPIPSYIPLPITLQEVAKNPTQQALENLLETLKSYAYVLYADTILKSYGIPFGSVFSNDLQLLAAPTVTESQKVLVTKALEQTTFFTNVLLKRLDQNQSSLSLTAKESLGAYSYILSIMYQPIFPVFPLAGTSMTQLPYTSFPTAFLYYTWAQKLSDPSVEKVQYGPQTVVSAKWPEIYTALQITIGDSYLSAAETQKKRIDYVLNGGDISSLDPMMDPEELAKLQDAQEKITALKQVKKDDMNVQLADYSSAYALIKEYLANNVITYMLQASDYFKNDSQKMKNFTTFMSDIYIQLGDTAQSFLIGNPLNPEYFVANLSSGASTESFASSCSGVLRDVLYYYMLAYALVPERKDTLLKKAIKAFTDTGDTVIKQGNYFGSLSYYKVGAFAALQTSQKADQSVALIKFLQAMFQGSTKNIVPIGQSMVNPLAITLTSGKKQEITFEQLATTCPSVSADRALCDAWEGLGETLLEACLYYMDCMVYANIFANPGLIAGQSSSQDPTITKQAVDLIDSYTKDNAISLDTIASVTAFIMRENFEQLVMGGFNQGTTKVLRAKTDTDIMIGYAAIKEWSTKIFFALGQLYIYYYVSNVNLKTGNPLLDFFQALTTERQSIIAPPAEWLGR